MRIVRRERRWQNLNDGVAGSRQADKQSSNDLCAGSTGSFCQEGVKRHTAIQSQRRKHGKVSEVLRLLIERAGGPELLNGHEPRFRVGWGLPGE